MRNKKYLQIDPVVFSFNKNLENPYDLIYEEAKEPVDSERAYPGSNLCGIVDRSGNQLPWGRSEILEDPEYVCIGCSCTVSMGLIEEYSWPSIIRALTGKRVNNLSSPGAGIEFLCSIAIDSFAKFGKPKKVLALFPDVYRMWTINSVQDNKQTHTIHASWHTEVSEYFLDVRHSFISGKDRPNTATPFIFSNGISGKTTFSPDIAIFNNFTILEILANYCKINDVEFNFASWENEANDLFSKMNHLDKNYIPAIVSRDFQKSRELNEFRESTTGMDSIWWQNEVSISDVYRNPWRRLGFGKKCDHYPQTEYQEKWWSVAGDSGNHPGIHDQIHFAEHLLRQGITNNFLGELP